MRSKFTLFSIVATILLAIFPIIPTGFLYQFTPLAYDASANRSSLNEDEVRELLDTVMSHKEYGRLYDFPEMISAYDYFFVYKTNFGILSVHKATPDVRKSRCTNCTHVVDTGFTCGGLCGGGTTFYLKQVDGTWLVEAFSQRVSQR